MKIIIFGASGGLGVEVMEFALRLGHFVTAFVRSPEKVKIRHPNLTVFQGNVMDSAAIAKAIAGQDAVISTIGPSRPPIPHMMERAAKNIVAGMREHGVLRLISTTGAGVRQPEDQPKFVDNFFGVLLNLLAKEVVADSVENVRALQASDLDWTIVRLPRLVDGKYTGKYRVGFVGRDSGTQLARADGADFILKELSEKKWVKKLPVVSY